MLTITTPDARRIAERLTAAGLELPPGVAAALDLAQALDAAATVDPVTPLADAITAGTANADELPTAVQGAAIDLLAVDRARQVAAELHPAVDRLARIALAEHADDLLLALRPTFDAAALDLTEAVAELGDNPTKESMRTPAGAAAWSRRDDAIARLRTVHLVRDLLAHVGYGSDHRQAWYVAALTDAGLPANGHRFADLLAAGYALRLNLPEESAALAQGAALLDAQRDAARRRRMVSDTERRLSEARADAELAAHRRQLAGEDEPQPAA